MGAAAQHATTTSHARLAELRDQLHRLLVTELGDRVCLNGHPDQRLPNTLNISIEATVGAQLLAQVPQLAASTGSACHDGGISSPVLAAMGLDAQRAAGAIRLSLGASTTEADIRHAARLLTDAASGGRG
jgi:cysteine desulfurase